MSKTYAVKMFQSTKKTKSFLVDTKDSSLAEFLDARLTEIEQDFKKSGATVSVTHSNESKPHVDSTNSGKRYVTFLLDDRSVQIKIEYKVISSK